MKTGILFDLDGTLWDSSENVVRSWNIVLENTEDIKEPVTVEQMKACMGKTMEDIAYDLFKGVSRERAVEIMRRCVSFENEYISEHGGVLFPGVHETLAELHDSFHISIVSNCQEGYIPAFMHYHHMEDVVDDYEEYGRTGKLKAANIRLTVQRNSLDRAVYVGDTMGDCRSSYEAGVPFIHAAYGFGTVPEGTPKIDAITELPSMLSSFQFQLPGAER